ncbi:hypothetical protein EUGRSUZ_L01810 [Eucalyptus grandis]|uniref:Uncharacterized protein n=1 Tax=Eucalyptus grandis TaxID=71139 RepID=A0A058ZTH4_EUCGR|nr:hypothetical protein EUGRSUZ_L01810 [Eucalyptus grandis]
MSSPSDPARLPRPLDLAVRSQTSIHETLGLSSSHFVTTTAKPFPFVCPVALRPPPALVTIFVEMKPNGNAAKPVPSPI